MKGKKIGDAFIGLTAVASGAALSRLAAENLPVENIHIKRGALVVTGILGAVFLDRKSTVKSIGKDVSLSIAATQGISWVKDVLAEKAESNKFLKTALGSPKGSYANPVEFRMGYVNFDNSIPEYQEESKSTLNFK